MTDVPVIQSRRPEVVTGPGREPRVLCCSVTAAGSRLAARLPYEHVHGALIETVARRWSGLDALVVVGATGIAVRAVAPHLGAKDRDPAVVVVDDLGRHVISLLGGHAAGGNVLTEEIAALLEARPVVTTATDGSGRPGLDTLVGLTATGDVAGVTRRWLDGAALVVSTDRHLTTWPVPPALVAAGALDARTAGADSTAGRDRVRVLLTDRVAVDDDEPMVALRPPSLVVGVGSSRGADTDRLADLVSTTLRDAGLHPASVALVASLDLKADEPAIVALAEVHGVELRTFSAGELKDIPVPTPSPVVAGAVGTPSVAEAAALLAAGPGAVLVVPKQVVADATVAVARRARPEGHLAVVGLGPGASAHRTPAAAAAVRHAEVVIGYGPYVDQAADLLGPAQVVVRSPIGAERDRCREAVARAAGGEHVALVCSGDAGVYAMASLVYELTLASGRPPVTVVPGVTAATAAAAVLGAPLGHDHCSISLSDLLTPWTVIEERLRGAADGDFVVSLYNPRSRTRRHQLPRALALLGARRGPDTPAAIVTNVGRPGQRVVRTTLGNLDPDQVDMLSLVVIGSSITRWSGPIMVTPRGYLDEGPAAGDSPDHQAGTG
jgi:cobalt-precorrin 5A hydrolase/precorrin-3B C17-methyltransferase